MTNINSTPEENIWIEIEAFLNGFMSEDEELSFKNKLDKDAKLRTMVAFSKAVDIREGRASVSTSNNIVEEISALEIQNELDFMDELHEVAVHKNMSTLIKKANDKLDISTPETELGKEQDFYKSKTLKVGYSWLYKSLVFKIIVGIIIAIAAFLLAEQYFSASESSDPLFYSEISDLPAFEYLMGNGDHGAGLFYRAQDYEQAAQRFNIVVDSLSKESNVSQEELEPYLFYLGVSRFKLEEFEEAKAIFRNLSRDTVPSMINDPEYLYLGLIYFREKDFREAKNWLERAAASDHKLIDGSSYKEVAKAYLAKIDSMNLQ